MTTPVPTGFDGLTTPALSFATSAVSSDVRADKKGTIRLKKVALVQMALPAF